jgi:hypothetical protein
MLGPRTRSAAQREDVRAEKVQHEESGDDEHSPKKAKIGNARLRAAQKNGKGGAGVSAAAAASTLYAITCTIFHEVVSCPFFCEYFAKQSFQKRLPLVITLFEERDYF